MNREQCPLVVRLGIFFGEAGPPTIAHTGHREPVGRKPAHEEVQVFRFHHGSSIGMPPYQANLPILWPLLAVDRRRVLPALEILLPVHPRQGRCARPRGRPVRADGPLAAPPFIHNLTPTYLP